VFESVIERLIAEYPYQIKFVVDTEADVNEIRSYLLMLSEIDHDRVMLMPQGTSVEQLETVARWLKPYCQQSGFRYCPRKQIEWFGHARST